MILNLCVSLSCAQLESWQVIRLNFLSVCFYFLSLGLILYNCVFRFKATRLQNSKQIRDHTHNSWTHKHHQGTKNVSNVLIGDIELNSSPHTDEGFLLY